MHHLKNLNLILVTTYVIYLMISDFFETALQTAEAVQAAQELHTEISDTIKHDASIQNVLDNLDSYSEDQFPNFQRKDLQNFALRHHLVLQWKRTIWNSLVHLKEVQMNAIAQKTAASEGIFCILLN